MRCHHPPECVRWFALPVAGEPAVKVQGVALTLPVFRRTLAGGRPEWGYCLWCSDLRLVAAVAYDEAINSDPGLDDAEEATQKALAIGRALERVLR